MLLVKRVPAALSLVFSTTLMFLKSYMYNTKVLRTAENEPLVSK